MKKIISILLVIVMCVSLSSCVMHTGITILEDGQVELSSKITYSKTALDRIVEYLNANIGKEIEFMGMTEVLDEEGVVEMEASIEELKLNAKEDVVGDETYYIQEETETVDLDYFSSDSLYYTKATTTEFLMYSYKKDGAIGGDMLAELEALGEDIMKHYQEITGEEIKVEYEVAMPYKIVKTNATLVNDYTFDLMSVEDTTLYAITEKADESLINAEDIKATIANMAKEDALNSKAAKPGATFSSKTSISVEINDSRFDKYAVEYKVSGGKWKLYKTTSNYYCNVKKLQPGKKYFFRITGILETDEFGELRGITSKEATKNFADLKAPKFTLSSLKKGFKVSFTKRPSEEYQVKYSTNKNMKKAKTAWVYSKTQKVNGLKAKTTYYVQVRKSVDYVYGDWSKAKKIKTK